MTALTALIAMLFLASPPTPPLSIGQITGMERAVLRGLTEMVVLVEDGIEAWPKCNISKEALALSAAAPLVDADLRVFATPSLSSATLYVRVNAIEAFAGNCMASLRLEAHTYANAALPHQGGSGAVFARVQLWEGGGVFTGPAYDFGQLVNASIKEKVGQFATKVKLANQK